jgi:hypothetical protein
MNQLTTLLKDKHVLWALFITVLSVIQGFVMEFPLTPMHQMIVGIVISVVVVLLRIIETPTQS